jgi:hypothetical protein
MGIFGKKQIEDKPLDYHAGVVAMMLGGRISTTQFPENQSRFGGAIASVLNLYSSTLPAPALLNMLAIGSGKEFKITWDKEAVREVLRSSPDSLSALKEGFLAFANNRSTEKELINTIIRSMGYSVDENFKSEYEGGLLFTAHQILKELSEKVKGDTRNGMSGQIANDAYTQGVVASMFIGLLIACENSLK